MKSKRKKKFVRHFNPDKASLNSLGSPLMEIPVACKLSHAGESVTETVYITGYIGKDIGAARRALIRIAKTHVVINKILAKYDIQGFGDLRKVQFYWEGGSRS